MLRLTKIAALLVVLGIVPMHAEASGLAGLLSGLRTLGGKGVKVLDTINTTVPKIDKTKDILGKWSDEWSKDLNEQNEGVKALTGEVKKLKSPADKNDREDYVEDLSALRELVKNERDNLKKKRDDVRKAVDKCLVEKKAIFDCEDIFSAIDLSSYRQSLTDLESAIDAKLKDAKKAPKS